MVEGVIHHCTEMEVDRQYVDSHGQSTVAFAFCRLLGFQLLPRLKAIHSQKLHRPGTGKADAYANLQLILSKPMRTTLIETIARVSGINVVNLLSRGYGDARWMTYRQAQTKGYQVRRGEKGTQVQYWRFDEERKIKDSNGRPVIDANGEPHTEKVRLERPQVFIAYVFSAEQLHENTALLRELREAGQ